MIKNKKFIRLFLLIICVKSSLIYPSRISELSTAVRSAVSFIWDELLHHPIPSGIITSVASTIILDTVYKKSKTREVEKNKMKSEAELAKVETEKIRQQIELQSRPDWQDAQIKMMAAAAYETTDPTLVKQRIEEKSLELREKRLQLEKLKVQVASQKTSFLDFLKEKMIKIEGRLKKDESLSEEQQRDLYTKLIRFGGIYKGVNSPIAT